MVALFQTVLMHVALCGLAASLLLLVLRSRIVRDTFARLLSIWRSLTVFGRVAVCTFLLIGVLVGGDKTNGVNNLPPQQMMSPMVHHGNGSFLTGLPVNGNLTNVMNLVQSQTTFAERKTANWNIRGAWKDSFWLDFGDNWVFPWGTNHLPGVEVVSYGQVWASPFDTNAVASAGAPFEIVPGLSLFGYELTPSNSYRFVWTDAAVNRDTNNLVSAALELFRNGDVSVTTNGVATILPRELPFPHSGFGQDDDWVTANFTNAAEILSIGYSAWVDAQVGTDLTNGLYKLSVTVADDPPETTFLSVGDLSVAITNAGEYVFLVEKGPAYDLTVFPPSSNVTVSAVDDIAAPERGGSAGAAPGLRHAGLRSGAGGNYDNGAWTPDGGRFWTEYVSGMGYARFWWLPSFCGSPDVSHLDSSADAVEFHASLSDYRGALPSFTWTATDGLEISEPNSQTTEVTSDGTVSWNTAYMAVTASFGEDRDLTSYIYLSYGTNDTPQVSCSLSLQNVLFINEGGRSERVYSVSVSLLCPVDTNGVVDVFHEGSDGALFWSDSAATQPLSSLSGISLSSVTGENGGSSYTFYMTSPNVGSGSFTATFTLPSGETRGVSKPYRAIEPIRKLVCSEIDPEYSCVFNPSRLVYGQPARLKVGVNGNFTPSDVEWRVVSGPGTVTRGEDDFGEADWTASVTATAESGEVVVEARFNEDPIQPRFVLPIVRERHVPIKAYFICDANGEGVISQSDMESKIQYANVVWRQAGVMFYLSSPPVKIHAPQCLDLPKHNTVTNAQGALVPGKGISQAVQYLLSQTQSNDCIRVLSVQSFTDSMAAAFTLRRNQAVFLSGVGNMRVLSHELGHIIGLDDIYEYRKIRSGRFEMTGLNEHISKECFSDQGKDWGAETGWGFYPETDTQCMTVKSLLMYGYDNASVASAVDIPSGCVRGLSVTANHPFATTNICVGANFIIEQED